MIEVTRAPYADELVIDGESVVLLDGTAVRLSPLATWALSQMSTDAAVLLELLADRLRDEFGEPPQGTVLQATQALVDHLVAEGIVTVADC